MRPFVAGRQQEGPTEPSFGGGFPYRQTLRGVPLGESGERDNRQEGAARRPDIPDAIGRVPDLEPFPAGPVESRARPPGLPAAVVLAHVIRGAGFYAAPSDTRALQR